MSQTHINFNDKYYRELKFSGTGIVNTRHSVSLSRKKDQHLSTENTLRVRAEGVNAGNVIELQVKILNETNWTTIGTSTGTETKTFDIRSWDQFRFNVTTFDAPGEGVLHVSGFVAPISSVSGGTGDCVKICDEAGNEIDLILVEGVWTLPITIPEADLTQEHINSIVASPGTPVTVTATSGNIRSIIIQNPFDGPNKNNSNKVLLVSWDNGTTYFSVPNGAFYVAENIDEPNITIDSTSNNTKFEIVLEHD